MCYVLTMTLHAEARIRVRKNWGHSGTSESSIIGSLHAEARYNSRVSYQARTPDFWQACESRLHFRTFGNIEAPMGVYGIGSASRTGDDHMASSIRVFTPLRLVFAGVGLTLL